MIFPYARDDCRVRSGNCKCVPTIGAARGGARRTILIGDGRSDLCAAGAADYVFAKKQLLVLCRERGIAHRPFETFDDAARLLADLVDDGSAVPPPVDIEGTTYA